MENCQIEMDERQSKRLQSLAEYCEDKNTEPVEENISPKYKTSQDVKKLDASSAYYVGVTEPEEKSVLEQSVHTYP